MKELIKRLNEASDAYYLNDNPIMSDKEYDDLLDQLEILEKETGIIMVNSPTQKVQGKLLTTLPKVKHSKPMLSADKTKDINKIKEFVSKGGSYCSWKLDGLTLVTRYENGVLKQALTRGSGDYAEDVTEQARMITNLPLIIPFKGELELRGEVVVSWDNFNKINEGLTTPFSHPRNLAAGAIRQLDTNVVKSRKLEYIVFEVVSGLNINNKVKMLDVIINLGFDVVEEAVVTSQDLVDVIIKTMTADKCKYPVDGLIFEYIDADYSKSLGATSHHELCRIALKWEDETYETVLREVEWSTSRTGLINPVAIFDEVELDGALTTRATLHNLSYIKNLKLGIGDVIEVYKANAIIPKVHKNLTQSDTLIIPEKCPMCEGKTEVRNENGSEFLHCLNEHCQSKLLWKLVHFAGKKAINIDDLSESTLQFLIDKKWVSSYINVYGLNEYKEEWMKEKGFGKKSVTKLLDNIQKSTNTTLERFLYSLSIPLIGHSVSKEISKVCSGDFDKFCEMMIFGESKKLLTLDGFGEAMYKSLTEWWNRNKDETIELSKLFNFDAPEVVVTNNTSQKLAGKIFVITGSLEHFKNRDELVNKIESEGGKVSGSVSKNTDFLVNNDITSTSGKNNKAKSLEVPIITELDLLEMM